MNDRIRWALVRLKAFFVGWDKIPIGYEACFRTTTRGNCRLPKDHSGDCI